MSYHDQILDLSFIEVETLPVHATKKWSKRDISKLKGMVVHQSLEEYRRASGNAKYHVGPNHISEEGLPGLSYTFFVEESGKVICANHIEDKTYSQGYGGRPGDENEEFVSVCVGGNFSGPGYQGTQEPSDEQLTSVQRLWNGLALIFDWTNGGLYGHYHFGKPSCPGDILTKTISDIRPRGFSSMVERQKVLQKLGYYKGDVDGIWGPASKAALVEFQRTAGLIPDGAWGDKTTEAVKAAMVG